MTGCVSKPANGDPPLVPFRNPVVDDFFEHTTSPSQAQLDYLTKRNGVPHMALAYDGDRRGYVVGTASVVFRRKRFDFAAADDDGQSALIIVARDRLGVPRDLVAWWPREDRAAAHYGYVSLLGEQDLDAPRADSPLQVHRGILGWLKAHRLGVVVLDKRRAWRALDGVKVAAEDIEHGLELRDTLSAPLPAIVVPAAAVVKPGPAV